MEKVTVKELKDKLSEMPDDYEVVIYPKYAEVDGYKKHRFNLENVCEQEPYACSIKNNPEKLKEYFNNKKFDDYEVNKHVAIIF